MKLYQIYLAEKNTKIHPKLKSGASWFAATPASDVALAVGMGGKSYRAGKAAGLAGKTIAKNVTLHTAKGAAISLAAYAAYRVIRSWFDKCEKQCGRLEINTPKRQLCKLLCKKGFLQKSIQQLNKEKNGETDPKKVNKIKQKIDRFNVKLIDTNKKIVLYKKL